MMRAFLVLLACLFIPVLNAQGADGEEVVIRSDGDKTFYEYRRGGEVVEIKVVPKYGKPYYLRPAAGDAAEDGKYVRSDSPDIAVPGWVIFRW